MLFYDITLKYQHSYKFQSNGAVNVKLSPCDPLFAELCESMNPNIFINFEWKTVS